MKNEVMEKKNEIQSRILTIRGVQVMPDRDLAALYGVEVKQLNRQVRRNVERFPRIRSSSSGSLGGYAVSLRSDFAILGSIRGCGQTSCCPTRVKFNTQYPTIAQLEALFIPLILKRL